MFQAGVAERLGSGLQPIYVGSNPTSSSNSSRDRSTVMIGHLRFRVQRASIAFCSFLVLLCLCSPGIASALALDEDYMSIQQADEAVSSAFVVVLDAEVAGANVSMLVAELNEAVGSLVEANLLLANGMVDEAAEAVRLSVEIAERVEDEGLVLKASVLAQRDFVFMLSVAGSIVGVPVFLVFMLFVWRRFKRSYERRVLGLKPEVVGDVEA